MTLTSSESTFIHWNQSDIHKENLQGKKINDFQNFAKAVQLQHTIL